MSESSGRLQQARFQPVRLVTYLAGCLWFSVGATLFIVAELGTDPLDVFVLGLREHVPITIGLGQAGVAAVCVLVWAAWNRRRPLLSPFLTFLLCGSIIDLLLLAPGVDTLPVPPLAQVLLAGLCCALGSALIIMSAVGIRAMDLVAITMVERWRWPFWAAKGVLESVLLVIGWKLGGPVGIGTVVFLMTVDLLIQPIVAFNARLGIQNRGLPDRRALVPKPAGGAAT